MSAISIYAPPFGMVDLANPALPEVPAEEIFRRMSTIKRFSGMGMSVLHHCLVVVGLAGDIPPVVRAKLLLHDAAEVVTGDFPSPVKHYIMHYGNTLAFHNLEVSLTGQIYDMLGVPRPGAGAQALRQKADNLACMAEARLILPEDAFLGEDLRHWPAVEVTPAHKQLVLEAMNLRKTDAIDAALGILEEAKKCLI